MTNKEQFCRIVRERSKEHKKAVNLMLQNGLYGQAISILRQELDSMVRVIFLLEEADLSVRSHFIGQTLKNKKWTLPNSRTIITDRHMVEIADFMFGWTQSVYRLGCAFIHLSPMNDYKNENPFLQLTQEEKDEVREHLNNYHSFPLTNDLTMQTVSPYLQRVFTKVSDNLEYYIGGLENDRVGDL
ncbi:MAG: hypothetical protein V4547_00365 [Bacteroidota bacterium]